MDGIEPLRRAVMDRATITLERGGATLVFKNVAADVCENCGEAYLDESTTARLLRAADEAARGGVQVEVRTLHDNMTATSAVS